MVTQLNNFKFTAELHDLGQFNEEWSGILSPLYDRDLVNKYVHKQFWEDASKWIDFSENFDYWKWLLQKSQESFSLESSGFLRILDVGSGGGNTVFPLLELYPHANVIASDLSVPLLRYLKQYYDKYYSNHHLLVIQMNAEELIFEDNQMDLVVGGAILHHLLCPSKALEEIYRVLTPGRLAVFYEPFEIGNQIIALTLKHLITLNHLCPELEHIHPDIINTFKNLCNEINIRKGIDKTGLIYQQIEDKWLFTKGYLENIATSIGFSEIVIYPIHNTNNPFSHQINYLLQAINKVDVAALPQWATKHIHDIDQVFSEELRNELLIEGCVILKK